MFAISEWSKRRRIVFGCLGLASCLLLSAAAYQGYRHITLPERVASGRVLFEHVWQPHDELANGGDGLGPVFNERSCVACHSQGGTGGSGPVSKNVAGFEVLPTKGHPELVSGVVHASAIRPDCQETFDRVAALFPIIPGGQRVVQGCLTKQLDFNPVVQVRLNSPALFGAGLIDDVSGWSIHGEGLRRSAQVMSNELSADFSGTTVGRVRKLPGGRVGKFGWKGQFASLGDFVASACAMELGLTNPQKSQMAPGEFREDRTAALDMTARQLDELISYVAMLPPPQEILPTGPHERELAIHGKAVFSQVGCADCHTPDLGSVQGIYSDFRLYDIDPAERSASYSVVATPVALPEDHPRAAEWKTPPLWGVADSAPYFHDGASPTLDAAITRHEGSAKKSKDRFKKLNGTDRQALLAFLGTLRAPR